MIRHAVTLVAVSIAEAILWGEQRGLRVGDAVRKVCFNRRGDSLGGATAFLFARVSSYRQFQSQRRFFGGSNVGTVRSS